MNEGPRLRVSVLLGLLLVLGSTGWRWPRPADTFNPQAALGVMCRNLLSVSWDGQLYDCDFNQALKLPLAGQSRTLWDIAALTDVERGPIAFANHCYGCTARHRDHHARAFGYTRSNVEFHLGDLADLAALDIADASVDVVVSNCVLNLVPDKRRALAAVFRVLKPGGELYFSDVYSDRRLPRTLLADPLLLGECLAGALYVEDFRRLLGELGVADARACARSPIALTDEEVEQRIGFASFESITWRAFKLPLEDRCEDYGRTATYLGTMPEHPHRFALDDQHLFETGRPLRVCGNSADMLAGTRYGAHFRIHGDKSRHFGLFDCGPGTAKVAALGGESPCC